MLISWASIVLALVAGEAAYRLDTIPIPDAIVLEVGGMDFLADGRLAVCTRRGEVWLVENPCGPPAAVRFKRFASGLHEPLGLAVRDGRMYVVQRGELTCLVDEDHDDRADLYATVCDAWSLSGNYHEYAYGPKFDADGNAWITLNLAHDNVMTSPVPWRGWAVKVTPDGTMVPVAAGLRSPAGIGMDAQGNVLCTDNQGEWVGACRLTHLEPGVFAGHPASLAWCSLPGSPLARPADPPADKTMREAEQTMPALRLPAVWFPYRRMGQSASDIVCDRTQGKFGPFMNQLFIGDQTTSEVMRVFLERVAGELQGACFSFRSGFDCGVVRLAFAPDGSLFAGMTNRGWASRGNQAQALQRLVFTGETPFEMLAVRARADGFELEFTAPVDRASAADPRSYAIKSFTYQYHPEYGSPEIDTQTLNVVQAVVAERHVQLHVSGLRAGYVHELESAGVRSAAGELLAHPLAFYTLNHIPDAAPAPAAPRASGQ
ncbi:MAG: hypothetical protein U1E76_14875 [Planctomycetota bacterium]